MSVPYASRPGPNVSYPFEPQLALHENYAVAAVLVCMVSSVPDIRGSWMRDEAPPMQLPCRNGNRCSHRRWCCAMSLTSITYL
jgi:hypothetical protein